MFLKMGSGAECVALRDEKMTQIWHPPRNPFSTGVKGNINWEGEEGEGKGEGRRGRGRERGSRREGYLCKQSNFSVFWTALKRTLHRSVGKPAFW